MPAKSKPADPAELVSEDAIRQRAYFMWEADGRPEGGHEHYWRLAHTEATRAFIEATTNGVARATKGTAANGPNGGKSAKAGKDKQAKAAKPKAVKAAAEAKPATKKSTKPRAAVPAARKAK